MSNTDSRSPHFSGSESTTGLPVAVLVTTRWAISWWACPTRIASMPGTCCATSVAAFSGNGSASPYDEDVSAPECAATTTTSAPLRFISGTYRAACSTSPSKCILPSTLALSQIAMPGLVSPRMPTLIGLPCGGLHGLDHVRLERGPARAVVERVRGEQREVELLLERAQVRDAVVELVVPDRRGVVADGVHRGGHRVLDASSRSARSWRSSTRARCPGWCRRRRSGGCCASPCRRGPGSPGSRPWPGPTSLWALSSYSAFLK